ncbi:MAG: M48 family metallopeptidase, partial [Bacillota bacterium]
MVVTVVWVILAAAALSTLAAVLAGLLSPVSTDPLTRQYFSRAFLERAAAYQRVSLTVYLLRRLVSLAFLTALVTAAMRYWRAAPPVALPRAAALILLFLLLFQLVNLPFDYYRSFIVEHRFGFSAYTLTGWLLDYGKSAAIGLLISTGGLIGLYFLLLRRPERWWVAAGTALTLFMLIGTYLYPLIIDPLFNRFTPLEDEALNSAIVQLAAGAGIKVDQVLIADASRRTNKVNAYFTGVGRTKRIVIYDTLLERFSAAEVLAVIAHEMGHWRGQHILKGMLVGALGSFAALFLLNSLVNRSGLAGDFRVIPLALLFFLLLSLAA